MRIISGWARGRRLFSPAPKDQQIRPTADRAREALFSILGTQVQNARILDLFAGTGALGLEAMSRGAARIVFVDLGQTALQLIKKNVAICLTGRPAHEEMIDIIRHDLSRGLTSLCNSDRLSGQFDLIFLDPPYGKGLAQKILTELASTSLIHDHTIIMAEETADITLPEQADHLHLIDQRQYGDSGFWFYRPQGQGATI
ncbi:MAG: 16S rRNA (guanine(966)-N(2))-methyltransferase RsmD [Desulfobulbaceae bacterium]|uniref:16S rRNA (Guanine(966)-N(2))-methyltransferase RsmD n=1 Tax=Candidatus Desulfatifera sulfidica TaxID=2841691 RepID=A0A8J6N972_9BACT|nr:16S rRNA (guanine(966)-N(2))-methyltransferase RsmD [Candidatus Desulfatifera sulfidica]